VKKILFIITIIFFSCKTETKSNSAETIVDKIMTDSVVDEWKKNATKNLIDNYLKENPIENPFSEKSSNQNVNNRKESTIKEKAGWQKKYSYGTRESWSPLFNKPSQVPKNIRDDFNKFKKWIDDDPFRKREYFRTLESWVIGKISNSSKQQPKLSFFQKDATSELVKYNHPIIILTGIDTYFISETLGNRENIILELSAIIDNKPTIYFEAQFGGPFIESRNQIMFNELRHYSGEIDYESEVYALDFINMLKNGNKLLLKISRFIPNRAKAYFITTPKEINENYYIFDLKGSSKALQF
jgi:hypothetical protein